MTTALSAYASSIDNQELKQRVAYSKTDLKQLVDETVAIKAKEFFELATQYLANLADYGITAATLTTLTTKI